MTFKYKEGQKLKCILGHPTFVKGSIYTVCKSDKYGNIGYNFRETTGDPGWNIDFVENHMQFIPTKNSRSLRL